MVASMIAGEEAVGQTFSELQFNDKYPSLTYLETTSGRALSPPGVT